MPRVLIAVCLIPMCLPVGAGNLLANGDFEGQYAKDGLAVGWEDNSSWADLEVSYSRDDARPRSGVACQKIVCSRLDYGAVQMVPSGPVPLVKGNIYRVTGWLRGSVGNVALQLRLGPAPYTVYVERGLATGDEWRELDYFWTCNIDDPGGRFMLRFTRRGTLWVDDLKMEEYSQQEAAKIAGPPAPGKLLHNGSFDLGLANWLLNHGADDWQQAEVSVIKHETDGQFLRLQVPEGLTSVLSSDVVPVTPGRPVDVSCRLRASAATTVTLSSKNTRQRVEVGEAWEEFHAQGVVGFAPECHEFVRLVVPGSVALDVDRVSLRQDGSSGAAAPGRPRAAIIPDDEHLPLGLYCQPDEPVLRLLTSTPAGAEPCTFRWTIDNFWGQTVREGTSTAAEELLDCHGLPRGWYQAAVRWSHEGRAYRNVRNFCVLPPAERKGDVAASPYGAHFTIDPTSLGLARAVGCRWLRLHPPNHTKWRVVEPQRGQWRWRDEPIRIARRAGLQLVGSLDRCPDWASTAPADFPGGFYTGKGAWAPRDWAQWEHYVAQTVRRYRDDIHIWEVWNEPNLTNWLYPTEGQTRAQTYAEMLRRTYAVVKREDPAAVVIGGCIAGAMTSTSGAWQFAGDIIDLGALDHMDVFSFHQYIAATVDEGTEPIDAWIARLREKMRAAGRLLPIINSEGGYSDPGTSISYRPTGSSVVPADQMARWLVRQYVSQMALGVRRFFFYNFFIDGSPVVRQWQGFLEGDGQPLPNVAAYAVMTRLLDGAVFERTQRPSQDLWIHRFRTSRGVLAVAWARTGSTTTVTMPGVAEAWDLMGAPLQVSADHTFTIGDAPSYLLIAN